jgi:hypothetical protein
MAQTGFDLQGKAIHFVKEAFKHYKPIGAIGEGVDLSRRRSAISRRRASR